MPGLLLCRLGVDADAFASALEQLADRLAAETAGRGAAARIPPK
jgi:hypothetical protein